MLVVILDSGYLHIGHAKAAFLNDYFAQDASSGSLILRFDDTNPLKEKQEYEDSIKEDLDLLGIKVQRTTYTSDYFEQLYDLAKQLISRGKAYADGTDIDNQALDRRNRLPSACRDRPAEESLAIFDEMRRGTDWGKKHCIRARIQYDNSNGSLRDPIIYRFPSWDAQKGPQPHHRTGLAWNIYPTYDFACPLVDSFEGVTHALRTTEYADRNAQYYWFLEALDLRRVHLWDFARINFIRTFLSKRKLARVVESGLVDGWDDPRLPTIRGIVRRGLSVDVLREFMLKQGPSRNVVSMDWTVLWAMNRKAIDPIASRYAAVEAPSTVLVTIEGVEKTWCEPRPMHPKNGDLGTKMMTFSNKIWIEQVDAASLLESEEVTLMHWGNAVVQDIVRNDGIVASMKMTLNLDGDASRTKKLHWVASKNLMHAELWEFGHLLTKDSLQKQDVLDDFLNPVTSSMVMAKIDRQFAAVKPGNFVQLERKGYYRVDGFTGQEALRTTVLFKIPNGARS